MWPLLCWLVWLAFLVWLGGVLALLCLAAAVVIPLCVALIMEDSNDRGGLPRRPRHEASTEGCLSTRDAVKPNEESEGETRDGST